MRQGHLRVRLHFPFPLACNSILYKHLYDLFFDDNNNNNKIIFLAKQDHQNKIYFIVKECGINANYTYIR